MSEFNIEAFKRLLEKQEQLPEAAAHIHTQTEPLQQPQQQFFSETVLLEQWQKGFQKAMKDHATTANTQQPTVIFSGGEMRSRGRGGSIAVVVAGALVLAGGYFYKDDITTYINEQKAEEVTELGAGGAPVYKRFSATSEAAASEQQLTGTAPMIDQQTSGNYVYSDTSVAWNVLVQSPDSAVFSIEFAVTSPAGGYEPDARLAERIASGDMTNQEIALFLVQNNVVPTNSTHASLFIELVGRSVTKSGERNVIHQLQLMP